jgi:two-component system sensor histidine kinase PilS (NtrC family)
MDIVLKESRRVSQSIDQFLNLASPGKEVFMTFDICEVFRETLTMLRMGGELNGRTEVKGNFATARLEYYGSPGQFKQVFWNLARNALKAMPEGGVLSVDFLMDGKERLRLRFADTGKGMTAEEQERIFEPFYSRFEAGQGLGMAVVRKIIEDYKGEIGISSEPHLGTEILITLPLQRGKIEKKE